MHQSRPALSWLQRRAFTLIDLRVVRAIPAILIRLLLTATPRPAGPAFGRVLVALVLGDRWPEARADRQSDTQRGKE